jgi:sRNA-binding carbon storage regulator CsrA
MLVLSRKDGEEITVVCPIDGTKITFKIFDAHHGRAKVGIQAPATWPILRGELGPYVKPGEKPIGDISDE